MVEKFRRMTGLGVGLPMAGLIAIACFAIGPANAQDEEMAEMEAEVVTAPMADTAPMTMDTHTLEDHSVTVGGVVEFVVGNTDNGDDGFDRGRFSRIIVSYSNSLDSGLEVAGTISYLLNSRDGGAANANENAVEGNRSYAPDVMFLSVGSGFGTVSVGSHAMALCSLHTRTVGLVPSGWNFGHIFAGFNSNAYDGWYAEDNYCGTPTAVSYASPSMGGFTAMVSFAPNNGTDQFTHRQEAASDAAENRIEAMGRFTTSMGGADIAVAAGLQTADDDAMDSTVVGAQASFGGITVGADWFDNASSDGYNIGAKYTIGSLSPGIVFSSVDNDDGTDAQFMSIGASYQLGGGMAVFVEYSDYEVPNGDEETAVLGGASIAF